MPRKRKRDALPDALPPPRRLEYCTAITFLAGRPMREAIEADAAAHDLSINQLMRSIMTERYGLKENNPEPTQNPEEGKSHDHKGICQGEGRDSTGGL